MKQYPKQIITLLIGFPSLYILLTLFRHNKEKFLIPDDFTLVAWIIFSCLFLLFLYLFLGLNIQSYFFPTNLVESKRHLYLFILTLSVVVNHITFGENISKFQGDVLSDLFDVVLIFSYGSLCSLFIIVLVAIENSLHHQGGRKNSSGNSFENDDPIRSIEEDVLGVREFAEALTKKIEDNNGKLIIGVYGPWGSGKSSLFSMMEEYYPKEQGQLYFTPWYFGENNHQIIPKFLEELAESIRGKQGYNLKLEAEIKKYATFFQKLQYSAKGVSVPYGEFLMGLFQEQQSLEQTKDNITQMLKASNENIIVFIDDLDRLDTEEIALVFKLVRLVCDFPNITYVLALDEEVVSYSLGKMYGTDVDEEKIRERGRGYLEKFIQVPIYLPKADEKKLKLFLLKGVEKILREEEIISEFVTREENNLRPIIDVSTFHLSIRNIKRYLNIVRFFVPLLKKEVFVDDLLYLLLLKVSSPGLYEWIRNHPDIVFQDNKEFFDGNEEVKRVVSDYRQFQKVIEELFPYMGYAFRGVARPKKVEQNLPNSHMPISSIMYFQKYFMYTTPYKEIPQEVLNRFYDFLSSHDHTPSMRELVKLEMLYDQNDILSKIELEVQNQKTDILPEVLSLYKQKYDDCGDNWRFKSDIVKFMFNLYNNKNSKEIFINSDVFNPSHNVHFLIELIRNIEFYLKNDETAERLKEIILSEFRIKSLEEILQGHGEKEQDVILKYWVNREKDTQLKRGKFAEYISSFNRFEFIISAFWSEMSNIGEVSFYQIVVTNLGEELTDAFLAEYENNQASVTYSKPFELIIEGKNKVFPFLYERLEKALIISEKQQVPNLNFEDYIKELIAFFLESNADEQEKQKIQGLLNKIKEFNNK